VSRDGCFSLIECDCTINNTFMSNFVVYQDILMVLFLTKRAVNSSFVKKLFLHQMFNVCLIFTYRITLILHKVSRIAIIILRPFGFTIFKLKTFYASYLASPARANLLTPAFLAISINCITLSY
jgi:hypothetical protein